VKTALRLSLLAALAAFPFLTSPAAGTAAGLQTTSTATSHKSSVVGKKLAAQAQSSQDIADAKAKGMVWANLSTHVYHKDSSSLYGTTKRGKFMTEDDAKKAGFRAANETGASKKHATAKAGQ